MSLDNIKIENSLKEFRNVLLKIKKISGEKTKNFDCENTTCKRCKFNNSWCNLNNASIIILEQLKQIEDTIDQMKIEGII